MVGKQFCGNATIYTALFLIYQLFKHNALIRWLKVPLVKVPLRKCPLFKERQPSWLTSSKSQSPEGSLVDIETSTVCLVTVVLTRKSTGMLTKPHRCPQTSSKQNHVVCSNELVHVLAIGY